MELRLNYPILLLSTKDSKIYVFTREKDFKSTNEDLFNTINYKNYYIIDKSGLKYKIKNAYKVKNLGFFGFNPFKQGKQILIDFEFSTEIEKLHLDSIKKELIQRVDQDKDYWNSSWDIEELNSRILNSKNLDMIILLLK